MTPEEYTALQRTLAARKARLERQRQRQVRSERWQFARRNLYYGGSTGLSLEERLADIYGQLENELLAAEKTAEAQLAAEERMRREQSKRNLYATIGTLAGVAAGIGLSLTGVGAPLGLATTGAALSALAPAGASLGHAAGKLIGGAETRTYEPDIANDIMAAVQSLSNAQLMQLAAKSYQPQSDAKTEQLMKLLGLASVVSAMGSERMGEERYNNLLDTIGKMIDEVMGGGQNGVQP